MHNAQCIISCAFLMFNSANYSYEESIAKIFVTKFFAMARKSRGFPHEIVEQYNLPN